MYASGMKYKSVLVISDMHLPYGHSCLIPFITALKKKYKPDKILCSGDEIDGQSFSMHNHSPDLMSPSNEFEAAIKQLKRIYKIFPKVDIMQSNHGDLIYRRGEAFGIPRSVFKSYRNMLEAPSGWRWHFELVIDTPGGKVYFHHARSASALKSSQQLGMNCVFGHHHSKFEIQHWTNGQDRKWGMIVGCLIDYKSLAFAYGKNNLKQPIIGCGIILNGEPKLLPMELKKGGKWTKRVP